MFLEEKFGLSGKTAVVTGGGSGIGQQAAIDLAKAGAKVAIFSRSGADETVKIIQENGGKAISLIADVRDEKAVEEAFEQVVNHFGGVHILFNNAGICQHKSALNASAEEFKAIMDTNLTGVYIAACAAARKMIALGIPGSIINVGSISGKIVNLPQEQTSYNASKAGVIHMTKSMAVEWVKYGIRVNSIRPGYIKTPMGDVPKEMEDAWMPMIPMHRWGHTEELTGMIIYLAGPSASLTTGQDFVIDGGYTCL